MKPASLSLALPMPLPHLSQRMMRDSSASSAPTLMPTTPTSEFTLISLDDDDDDDNDDDDDDDDLLSECSVILATPALKTTDTVPSGPFYSPSQSVTVWLNDVDDLPQLKRFSMPGAELAKSQHVKSQLAKSQHVKSQLAKSQHVKSQHVKTRWLADAAERGDGERRKLERQGRDRPVHARVEALRKAEQSQRDTDGRWAVPSSNRRAQCGPSKRRQAHPATGTYTTPCTPMPTPISTASASAPSSSSASTSAPAAAPDRILAWLVAHRVHGGTHYTTHDP